MKKFSLVLASQSPRRAELLREAAYDFSVRVPTANAEDARRAHEPPTDFVSRLAQQKAQSVAAAANEIIIGCDTVVVTAHGEILGKPKNRDDARRMLHTLRNTTQSVISGLALRRGDTEFMLVETAVTQLAMTQLTDSEIENYLDRNLWSGKAGGFGYQDQHGWLKVIHGSESNIVGMPMELFAEALARILR